MTHALTPIAQAVAATGAPPEQHAFLAPSSAYRWKHCTASAWMESQFPDLSDPTKAAEGTAAHWVMLHRLTMPSTGWLAEGSMAPNGVEVTRAMIDGVELLAQDIEERLGPNWASMVVVERPVAIPRVHPQANWGTPDVRAWVALPSGRYLLIIWDFKFGFSRVEVFENDQLVDYFAGCLSEAAHLAEELVDVALVVVQPRAYHFDGPVRAWSTTATGLRNQVHMLAMAAEEATSATPVCRPRPDVCENCRARSGCDALQESAYRGMDIARKAIPRVLSDDALGLELAMLTDVEGLLAARKSGLEELVKSRLSAGKSIAHWAYGPGQGGEKWTRPAGEVVALGKMFGVNLAKPLEVVTPIQAKAAGMPEDYMRAFRQKVTGAVKLIRSDGTDARRIFSQAKN